MLQHVDFVLQSIVDLWFLFDVVLGLGVPGYLRISTSVPLLPVCPMFSFSFIHASRSSLHFFVTFISVRIALFFYDFRACFATRIFPDRDLPVACPLSSCLRLLVDYDLTFGSADAGLTG